MGKTCCVFNCNTGTKAERRNRNPKVEINVYRFPKEEDPERLRWANVIGKINKNLDIKEETVVCGNIVRVENGVLFIHLRSFMKFQPVLSHRLLHQIDRRNALLLMQGI